MKALLQNRTFLCGAGAASALMGVAFVATWLVTPTRIHDAVRLADRALLQSDDAEPPVDDAPDTANDEIGPADLAAESQPSVAQHNWVRVSGRVVAPPLQSYKRKYLTILGSSGIWRDNVYIQKDGTFGFRTPTQCTLYINAGDRADFAPVPVNPIDGRVDVANADISDLTVVFEKGLTLHGTVVDSTGEPRPYTHVSMRSVETRPQPQHNSSAADGTIDFRNLSAGEYELFFELGNDEVSLSPEPQRIKVSNDTDLSSVVILCPDVIPKTHSLKGLVTDDRGRPVSGASILRDIDQSWRDNWSDSSGHFELLLSGTGDGRLSILARHDNFSDSPIVRVPFDATSVTLVLRPPSAVEGRVLDAETGQPIPLFRLHGIRGTPLRVENEDGVFQVENVRADINRLSASARGYASNHIEFPPLIPGETRRNLEIRLPIGVDVEGRVVNGSGQPVRLAQVHVVLPDGAITDTADDVTSFDGTFLLPSQREGPLKLRVKTYAGKPVEVTYNVVRGVLNDIRVVLPEGGRSN